MKTPAMAIRGIPSSREMTVDDFKNWLKQFDTDNDGRISRGELREAIRRRGGWFSGLKAGRAVRHADRDNSGFVDESEIENLVAFAQKTLGMKVTAW
ncbi:polcalcin Phl p 7 isoform X1 [Oryza sativa Japonica Group]|uniref:polcalcin Phl p 7 isoform X1 n=1 Tax=Oryza sativa subsp. japonica TaxID=39947 RepID=UPI000E1B86A5|nr:polcalcin Phl p 7 isoform X1 [Oryza sativa Japonica Group]